MKIAICGYGNLGRGVECAVTAAKDMELFAVFTKRDPNSVKVATDVPVYNINDILKYKDDIDVLVICAGSATDLPVMTPSLAKNFCAECQMVASSLSSRGGSQRAARSMKAL